MQDNKFQFGDLFATGWNPKPVEPPKVDPDITLLNPISRSAESIKYSVLGIEFWISPNGQVREWLRNNTKLAVLLAIPAFLVIPIITFVLWQLVSWMVALVAIAGKLTIFPVLAVVAIAAIWTIIKIIRGILGR